MVANIEGSAVLRRGIYEPDEVAFLRSMVHECLAVSPRGPQQAEQVARQIMNAYDAGIRDAPALLQTVRASLAGSGTSSMDWSDLAPTRPSKADASRSDAPQSAHDGHLSPPVTVSLGRSRQLEIPCRS